MTMGPRAPPSRCAPPGPPGADERATGARRAGGGGRRAGEGRGVRYMEGEFGAEGGEAMAAGKRFPSIRLQAALRAVRLSGGRD
jgi:hypothetical protein